VLATGDSEPGSRLFLGAGFRRHDEGTATGFAGLWKWMIGRPGIGARDTAVSGGSRALVALGHGSPRTKTLPERAPRGITTPAFMRPGSYGGLARNQQPGRAASLG